MTRQTIIERTIQAISRLPEVKAQEISDFADFISKRYEEQLLTQGIQKLTADGQACDFLSEDEELYSMVDLKETYNS